MISCGSLAQKESITFTNPILPGFYPDPSIERVGDDYYLVTSTFEWFPGIPIFHSKDLVSWEQIGHVLNRPEQLKMIDNKASSGVWAPTLRYNDGIFYVTATCKQCGNNFYVTAKKPEGPYSNPIYLDTPNGIDPSFFFDEDGRAWFTANRKPEPEQWPGNRIIYVQEFDTKSGKLIGQPKDLTYGMEQGIKGTEAPHLYKINGMYYLITAEGQTWDGHRVSMYYSDSVTGPYKQVKNPVITHEDKPYSQIQHTGHADLVQTQNGDWWAVMLGVRKENNNYFLGRETYLTPVSFEGIQPNFGGKDQILKLIEKRPDLRWKPYKTNFSDDFSRKELRLFWNFLRTPLKQFYSLKKRKGWLSLDLMPGTTTEVTNPALLARRFQHLSFTAQTKMKFTPNSINETAGLIAIQNERFQYRLERALQDGNPALRLIKVYDKNRNSLTETIIASIPYEESEVILAMQVDREHLQFSYGSDKQHLTPLGHLSRPQC